MIKKKKNESAALHEKVGKGISEILYNIYL